ncbi:MAG: MFS transporter [Ardenticatenaceae bacterium]|nr:MFS transporter [Ardenticatenaceae bacterium]
MKQNKLLLILIAYFGFVSLGFFDGVLGVAWPGMRETFQLLNRAQGVLVTLGVIGYISAGLANGRFITRYGIATLMVASAFLALFSRTLQAAAPGWWLVVLAAPLAGVGAGMLDAGMNTYAAARFRPRLINWLHASFGIGTTLGALAMTGILTAGGTWRVGFGLMGGLQLILLVLMMITFRRWRLDEPEAAGGEDGGYASNWETLRQPRVWLGIIVFFLYTGVEVGFANWAFTILTESRGFGEGTAGLLATLYWGCFTIGRIVLGFIETRLDHLVRWALFGAMCGALLFAVDLNPAVTILAIILLGMVQAPVFPALIAYTPRRVGKTHAPNAIGFQIAAAGIGVAVLPGTAGALGDWIGLEAIGWFILSVSVGLFVMHEMLKRDDRLQASDHR